MSWGAGRAGKMSQEYGPRGILLLLELGPIVSAVLTSVSATDAPFGKSTGNYFGMPSAFLVPAANED